MDTGFIRSDSDARMVRADSRQADKVQQPTQASRKPMSTEACWFENAFRVGDAGTLHHPA